MKKHIVWACALAFIVFCCLALALLGQFTNAEPDVVYLSTWEQAAVLDENDAPTSFDPTAEPPALAEGERYRYALTLPEGRPDGTWLLFETAGLEATVYVDGTEIWRSAAAQDESTVNLSRLQLPLPAGGGETLTMELRRLGQPGLFPPLARLTTDPANQASAAGYAAGYALPAGATALAGALLVGLLLLGVAQGTPDARLLLPALAALLLTAHRLALGLGTYFLPDGLHQLLVSPMVGWLPALALGGWLALHRGRDFWRAFAKLTGWSTAGLLVAATLAFAVAPDSRPASYLASLATQLAAGVWADALFWLTWWLVLISTALAAWELARTLARSQADAHALAVQNRLVMESYRLIEEKLSQNAAVQHEAAHRLTALDALAEAGDLPGLRDLLHRMQADTARAAQPRFATNPVLNAIIQNAAARAETAGVDFSAVVLAPEELPLPAEDLAALLLNMLDNALEAAPRAAEPFVRLRVQVNQGFLTIRCENSFDGAIRLDAQGAPATTKPDATTHGFGLPLMQRVAQRYGSVLDVQWDESGFTVQTALRLPKSQPEA